ncbi:Uncharacterised protein [Mycobacteroides abscessus subsp. abscessus]|nr:Uncharacterised protein [Mycobacteroides abscessus subsp. abscessus]
MYIKNFTAARERCLTSECVLPNPPIRKYIGMSMASKKM